MTETAVIIIGNILTLCAMITDSISGTRKKNKEILGVQIISQFFYGTSSALLKGYSSTMQNVVAVLRNLAAIRNMKSKALEWTLIVLGVVLGVAFNNLGLVGWLPIIANLEYSIAVFQFKNNERNLKTAFLISLVMYAVFCGFIMNYVGIATNLIVAATTLISMIRAKKKEQKS
ncbi:MAG: YgjV family protein [Firmicutes bacterium]|nr:YgjV family protein [Bacillota bacterium]